ncbi:hypothetical protein HYH03_012189 [Edaphochlamys debaryana]|uniref:Protein kinase domain-containing protein n=1 Tax=Edaphochlamys debaryana TaxID=47281 RepID=A0A835XTA5_9CHLO|nr:hypothetical protein HYH03_012189 [Edaphochlamys debaryana]|eukprot:KAG2489359.1 hypothetical protein HYH03_012189 [Edaphochlamys debaryana]
MALLRALRGCFAAKPASHSGGARDTLSTEQDAEPALEAQPRSNRASESVAGDGTSRKDQDDSVTSNGEAPSTPAPAAQPEVSQPEASGTQASPSPGGQPKLLDRLQVPFSELTFHALIGRGTFKQVYRGTWNNTQVAIVAMRRGGMVTEARVLQQLGSHPNLVQFYRWSTCPDGRGGANEYIVVELVPFGSLDKVLAQFGPSLRNRSKLMMCEQVCHAMCELASEGVLHRDLAARNILVQGLSPVHVKVADFGLARVAPPSGPEADEGRSAPDEPHLVVPVRWSAPEVLRSGQGWSEKSDVYSYGVTMWEIFSNGAEPYASRSNSEAMRAVLAGDLLPRPKNCPQPVYSLMLDCWRADPQQRPTFKQIADVYRRWRELTLASKHSTSSPGEAPSASAPLGLLPASVSAVAAQQQGQGQGQAARRSGSKAPIEGNGGRPHLAAIPSGEVLCNSEPDMSQQQGNGAGSSAASAVPSGSGGGAGTGAGAGAAGASGRAASAGAGAEARLGAVRSADGSDAGLIVLESSSAGALAQYIKASMQGSMNDWATAGGTAQQQQQPSDAPGSTAPQGLRLRTHASSHAQTLAATERLLASSPSPSPAPLASAAAASTPNGSGSTSSSGGGGEAGDDEDEDAFLAAAESALVNTMVGLTPSTSVQMDQPFGSSSDGMSLGVRVQAGGLLPVGGSEGNMGPRPGGVDDLNRSRGARGGARMGGAGPGYGRTSGMEQALGTMGETCVLSMEVETAIDPMISVSTMSAAINVLTARDMSAGPGPATPSGAGLSLGAGGGPERLLHKRSLALSDYRHALDSAEQALASLQNLYIRQNTGPTEATPGSVLAVGGDAAGLEGSGPVRVVPGQSGGNGGSGGVARGLTEAQDLAKVSPQPYAGQGFARRSNSAAALSGGKLIGMPPLMGSPMGPGGAIPWAASPLGMGQQAQQQHQQHQQLAQQLAQQQQRQEAQHESAAASRPAPTSNPYLTIRSLYQ